jgi:hypothetical protein
LTQQRFANGWLQIDKVTQGWIGILLVSLNKIYAYTSGLNSFWRQFICFSLLLNKNLSFNGGRITLV